MTVVLTYYGHSAVSIKVNRTNVLVGPFITENPQTSVSHLSLEADYILVSHGHEDPVGDTISIAERTGATVVANFEIANWLSAQGVERVHPQHVGGWIHTFVWVCENDPGSSWVCFARWVLRRQSVWFSY